MKLTKSEILNATAAIPNLQGVSWRDGRAFFRLSMLHKGLVPFAESVQEQLNKVADDHKDDKGKPLSAPKKGKENKAWDAYNEAYQAVLVEEEDVDVKARIPEDFLEKYRDDGKAPEFGDIYSLQHFITNGEAK